MIPAEWRPVKLGDCLVARPSYGINAPAVPHSSALPAYVRITDIDDEGRLGGDTRVSVAASGAPSYFLSDGDLVFARTGASVGKSYMYRPADGELVYAGFLIRVRPDQKTLVPGFLAQYARCQRYWEWVRATSMRSGQPGINGREYAGMPFHLPPLKEQQTIAEALSDADAAIEALDALIAKKRDVKQAAMQQLLTGRTRLPGFSGEWRESRLGDHGTFSKGQGIKKDEVVASGLPCIRYGQIYTDHSDWIRSFTAFISPVTAQASRRLVPGELLFAGSGETAAEIGKCVAFLGDGEAYAGGDIVIMAPRSLDSKFMGYALNSPVAVQQKMRLAQGDAVVHISSSSLATLSLAVPPLGEQQAIAEVLSDLDSEIEALVAERDKMRLVKQGMMQELLSGRVRLV